MTFQMTQYAGEDNLHGFGMSRELETGEIAERLFGDEYSSGNAFLYLFRRFGYPISGWDEYKGAADYVLTTPMDGIYLWAMIKAGDHASYSFGIRFSEEMYKKHDSLIHRYYSARVNLAAKHALKEGYPFVPIFEKWTKKTARIAYAWSKANGINAEHPTEEEKKRFWNEMEKRKTRAISELGAFVNPCAEPFHEFFRSVNDALEVSLKDLLRHTYVRDVAINILGGVDDPCDGCEHCIPDADGNFDGCEKCVRSADYFDLAGYGVYDFVNKEKESCHA